LKVRLLGTRPGQKALPIRVPKIKTRDPRPETRSLSPENLNPKP